MLLTLLLACLFFTATASEKSCSNADTTLVDYIKWQLRTTHSSSDKTTRCDCKDPEKRQIIFTARLAKDLENQPNSAIVKFEKVVLNEGEAYSSSTGKFTSPEDGIYSFSWTILTKPGSRFNSVLMVDGNIVVYNHNEAEYIKNAKPSTQTAGVKLIKGNKVWIQAYDGDGKFAYIAWSSFTGFKI